MDLIHPQRYNTCMDSPIPQSPQTLNNREAARYLGVSPSLVRKYAREGKIEFARWGARGREFSCAALDAFRASPRPLGRPPVLDRRDGVRWRQMAK